MKKKKATEAAHFITESEDKQYNRDTQLIRVRKSFMQHPKTMRQVAEELHEERSNICWYVGMLRDAGSIEVHYRGVCPTTGCIVNYYTSNKELFRENTEQLSLWPKGGAE